MDFFYHPTNGLLVGLTAPGGNMLSYTYDGSLPMSVTYDNNFRVTSQFVNGGNTVSYGYDQDGLLTQTGEMAITRDAQNGKISGTQLGNVTTSQSYNSAGELASYEARYGASTLFATTYARDSLGRITELTETVQGVAKKMNYGYDLVGRLEKVWRNDTLISTYAYDSNGNRLSHTTPSVTVTGTYDDQDRLLSYSNTSYSYTPNGELQTKIEGSDTTRYTYDAFGNLVGVVMPRGDLIEYIIDGQNRRIGKKVNGAVVKRWVYSGQLSPVAELDSAGNVSARFVGGYMTKGGTTYQLITDHLGSVRLVIDVATGTVAQRLDYDEFGNVTSDSNPNFQPFAYAGGLYDTQTKLVRFGARDYHATAGRWTAKDPIGFGGGSVNTYLYVWNDPINFIDPTGLQGLEQCAVNALQGYFPDLNLNAVEVEQGLPLLVENFATGSPSAFTFGNTIYFSEGSYNPHTAAGLALIGHELAHVEQFQEYGEVGFELAYLGAYLWNKMLGMSNYQAYSNISFELEASKLQEKIQKDLMEKYENENPCP